MINFLLFVLLGFILRHFLKKTLSARVRAQSSPQTRHMMGLLSTFAANIVFALTIVIGLDNLGIRLSFLGGTLGVLGIGIGIGLQNLAANLIGLVVILLEKSIQIGDLIEIDGVLGTVVEIKGRSTTIMSRDNIAIIIPNAHLISNKVINWSHRDPKTRMHLKVGIGMDPSLLDKAVDILLTIARNHPDILPDPAPTVWFSEFGASSFNLELIYWIHDVTLRHTILSDLNFRIASEFHATGIDLPYPHNVVILSGNLGKEAAPLAPEPIREDNGTHENRNPSFNASRKT
ncbi:MAG: mechanosensitive ion channel [Nitrospirae bacterium]|nr:mechanosensitive ion channel [Nitrospirota bacterium]MCL5286105.1 mechanosensitive ion channel [Nitrospirota bacterium]